MRTLLIPVDFSSHSAQAAHYAIALAKDLGTDVHLIHVSRLPIPPIPAPIYGTTTPYLTMEPAVKEMRHEAKESMRSLVAELDVVAHQIGYKGPILQTILEGDPVEEILHFIQSHTPDCLVMGVAPRSSLYRIFIGSVAGKLLLQARIPIIAIPSGAGYQSPKKMVFASDFDPQDAVLLRRIHIMLKQLVASWQIVHLTDEVEDQFYADREAELEDKLRERLGALPGSPKMDVNVLTEGPLLEVIEQFAREQQAAMVTFVTHRRNLFSRLIDPSVCTEAMFHIQLPMLFLHSEVCTD